MGGAGVARAGAGRCAVTAVSEPVVRVLPNRVTMAVYPMPWMRGVSAGIWMTRGSRHEPERHQGISHFVEHMLFKGTARRDARAITADVEGVGGEINAFTSEDHICYYAKIPPRHFARAADVLCDMYAGPSLDSGEIEREREVIREEILMVKDNPGQRAQEAMHAALWRGHAIGRAITGTVESVGRIRREELAAFVRAKHTGRHTVVAVAGAVEPEEVFGEFGGRLGRLAQGVLKREVRWRENRTGPRWEVIREDCEQTQVEIGFRGPDRHDPKRWAHRVLSVIVGEPMSSRLFQELREKRGLCYSVQSATVSFSDTGCFALNAALEAGRLEKALRLIAKEIKRARERLPSARELREARDYLIGHNMLGLESTTSRMSWLGDCFACYGRVLEPEEVERRIAAVTAEDVRAVASEFLEPARMACAVLGPVAEGFDPARMLVW